MGCLKDSDKPKNKRRQMMYNLTMRKFLSIFLIIILALAIFNLAKGSFESYSKLQELNQGQSELSGLKDKNQQLRSLVKLKQSDFAIEKEARDKLGFGRAGETAIVVQDQNLNSKEQSSGQKSKANFSKWLEFLKINL